jgi:hypothetical protein
VVQQVNVAGMTAQLVKVGDAAKAVDAAAVKAAETAHAAEERAKAARTAAEAGK